MHREYRVAGGNKTPIETHITKPMRRAGYNVFRTRVAKDAKFRLLPAEKRVA